MPQAFPNPVGSFTQGFTGGIQLGLQIKEQKAKVQARLDEIQKEKRSNAMEQLSLGAKYIAIPGMEEFGRNLANQGSIALTGQGLSKEQMGTVGSKLDPFLKEIGQLNAAFNDQKSPIYQNFEQWQIGAENIRNKATVALRAGSKQAEAVGTAVERAEERIGAPIERARELARDIAKEERKPPTPTSVEGLVLQKAREQGEDSLTPVEAKIFKGATSGKGVSVTVDLGKATKGKIESKIIEGQETIGQLNRAEATFKPEYLTYVGKTVGAAQRFADKLGLGTGTQFLEERTRWFVQAKQAFFVYRKWVTGVAGGEKEMTDIAKAFPDPEHNSPAEYLANVRETRFWKRAVDTWLRETRAKGLSISETREIIEQREVGAAFGGEDLSGLSDEELLNRL